MKELYQNISTLGPHQSARVLTVLEGDCQGEKALFSGGVPVWVSAENGFLSRHSDKLNSLPEGKITEIGNQKVFCEPVGREKQLVICGGGHVSIPVIRMGNMLGFHTVVLEDRPTFADHARCAGADEVFCEPFAEALSRIGGSRDTFFVIATRGHRYDQICLKQIAAKEHAYIGMIGSRRRTAIVRQTLKAEGVDPEVLDRVYTPIGLDIGAETPEEIAVAIMAEIISVKNQGAPAGEYSPELLQAILDEEETHGRKVLATIVRRRGSAPREVGTKMLVMEDGTCVGTVGGGCAEAEIIRRARCMPGGKEQSVIFHVDMTRESAEDEGMVCGGNIDVLLELL